MEKSFAFSGKSPLLGYDALKDKHASFYFNSHPVKKHLRKLKKAIDMEPHHSELEAYSLKLTQKIQQMSHDNIRGKVQPYQQTLKPASLQKLQQFQRFFNQPHSKKTNHDLPPLKQESHHSGLINKQKAKSTLNTSLRPKKIEPNENRTKQRQRSNQSLQNRIRTQQDKQTRLKEVRHEEFLSFLKEKQEALKNLQKDKNE